MRIQLFLVFTFFSVLLSSGVVFAQGPSLAPLSEPDSLTPLREELELKKKMFELQASSEAKRIFYDALRWVDTSGVLASAKKVGDVAPDFTLKNVDGSMVTLSTLLTKGPVVITWYRGGWCPYCSITLKAYQEVYDEFKGLGVSLIAISPELPDRAVYTSAKRELEFFVLSDVGNTVAKTYGVVYTLTPELAAAYQKNFDLHGFNGDASNQLPLAATYIIGKDGVITYAFLDADYRNRAEPSEVLEMLKASRSSR